jgi:hypothetical protein
MKKNVFINSSSGKNPTNATSNKIVFREMFHDKNGIFITIFFYNVQDGFREKHLVVEFLLEDVLQSECSFHEYILLL